MILLAALLVPPGPSPLPVNPSMGQGSRFGRAVLALSDLDDDGVRDFAVGAPTAVGLAGRVLVLSGADRSLLQVWEGESGRQTFGHNLRVAGEVDGDGCDDIIVGYQFGARTEVRSGKDGALLTAFARVDSEVHPFGDLDQDGRDELLLTAGRRWEIRSGLDGSLVGGPSNTREAGRFYSVGDVDGDGLADGVLIAKRTYLCRTTRKGRWGSLGPSDMPRELQVLVPVSEVWAEVLCDYGDLLAVRAAGTGDLDGDGTSDVLLSFATPPRDEHDFEKEVRLVVLSFAKPERALWSETHPLSLEVDREYGLGYAVATPGDLDEDGCDDLILADNVQFSKFGVSAYAPVENVRLWGRMVADVGNITGVDLSALEDRDDDGLVDVLVGSSDWYWHGPIAGGGTVTLVSGKSGEELWSIGEAAFEAVLTASDDPK